MIDQPLERCDSNDPQRCQGSSESLGQCPFKAQPGSDRCYRHGGQVRETAARKTANRMYRLAQWQNRVGEFADHEQIKCLNEEVGILRMSLEHIMVEARDPLKFAMNSNKISDLVIKIDKVVRSMHRMQIATGELIDRQKAIEIGQGIVGIISEYIKDPLAIEEVAEKVLKLVMQ